MTTRQRPMLVHLTTTDMSLDWLLGPQLRAFRENGYDVVGMSAPGTHVPAIEANGVTHVALDALTRSTSITADLRAFVQIYRALRKLRPDIVHTHNPKPGVLGRIAARLARVPLVVNTQHGLYAQPGDSRKRRWAVYAAERFAAAFGDVELVQNPEDVDTLVQRLRVPPRKVRLLGNGVDLQRFDPVSVPPGARAALRTEWRIADDEVVIGTVGRLVAEKGIAELCAAAHQLRGVARLVVIGPTDPGKIDAVPQSIISRARADGVVFAGRRDDMPECYCAFDIFVSASWREGFPRSAMEAAAMGLPIVATDIRGNRQVVADGVTGTLVPARDPGALTNALRDLAARPNRRRLFGTAARARAVQTFDDRQVVKRTLAAYRQDRDPEHGPAVRASSPSLGG